MFENIKSKRSPIGIEFIKRGLLTENQVDRVLEYQKEHKELKFAEIVDILDMCDKSALLDVLSYKIQVTGVMLDGEIEINPVKYLPRDIIINYKVLPFALVGNKLKVAFADPQNPTRVKEVELLLMNQGYEMEIYVTLYTSIMKQISNIRTVERDYVDKEEKDTTKLVDNIIMTAIEKRASDIHIEPMEDKIRVRYRIDGKLLTVTELPKNRQDNLIGRLKAISNMHQEIQESQDGRILLYDDYNIRVSSQRNVYGEKFVLRLLKKNNSIQSIFDLGYPGTPEDLDKSINKRNSITLIAAPTGEGKTTSLYSMLDYLNKPNINVTTIEDPVEIRIPGLNQIEVDPKSTFSDNLRTILRQDPDIILVGEIRDKETAEIAMQAGQTGHYVLSTIHTIDAVEVITRLRKIGISDYDISSTLATAISQRLVRKICPNCRKERPFNDQEKKIITSIGEKYGIKYDLDNAVTYDAVGCAKCNHSGYAGRIACFEILNLDEETKELIMNGASSIEIRKCALKGTYRPLLVDGINKVVKGITTLDELNRKLRVF